MVKTGRNEKKGEGSRLTSDFCSQQGIRVYGTISTLENSSKMQSSFKNEKRTSIKMSFRILIKPDDQQ